jgi:hypothetical protein
MEFCALAPFANKHLSADRKPVSIRLLVFIHADTAPSAVATVAINTIGVGRSFDHAFFCMRYYIPNPELKTLIRCCFNQKPEHIFSAV